MPRGGQPARHLPARVIVTAMAVMDVAAAAIATPAPNAMAGADSAVPTTMTTRASKMVMVSAKRASAILSSTGSRPRRRF